MLKHPCGHRKWRKTGKALSSHEPMMVCFMPVIFMLTSSIFDFPDIGEADRNKKNHFINRLPYQHVPYRVKTCHSF